MPNFPRRTVDEIIFLHTAEPNLLDIFVEGDYDNAILCDYIRASLNSNVSVQTIDTVEIDDGELLKSGRDANNRERVIYLAKLFENHYPNPGKAMFIADRDCSAFTTDDQLARDLYFTDHSCMEMYFWSESSFSRFLTIYCNKPKWRPSEVMECIREPLESMFAIRAAAERLNIRLNWIDRIVCVNLTGWIATLDTKEFAIRLLSKVALRHRITDFLQEVEIVRSEFSSDPRAQIHGHDLARFLSYLLQKKGVKVLEPETFKISRVLALSTHRDELAVQPLFARIDNFVAKHRKTADLPLR